MHNLTLEEQVREAQHTNNDLALAIYDGAVDTLQAEQDDIIEQLRDYVISDIETKFNAIANQWAEEHKKDGTEYEAFAEALDYSVAEECVYGDRLTKHIDDVISDYNYNINGELSTTYHIDKKLHDAYVNFTGDQIEALKKLAASDITASFNDDVAHAMESSRGLFYAAMFEKPVIYELEPIIEDMDIPTCIDLEQDINSDLSISGDYVYLDMSHRGIRWSIDLDWLECAITQIIEA